MTSSRPALDAGISEHGIDFDQRGSPHARLIGANADIGAFELDTVDVIFVDGFD